MKKCIFLLVICLVGNFIFAQHEIQKVEPPNWWIGMKHQQIQLLVYGNKIAELDPVIAYPGLSLDQVIKVQNPNYLFLNLSVDAATKAGQVSIDFYQNKKKVLQHFFPLLKREKNRKNLEGFNNSDAIYLITPDRFANGDEGNDSNADLKEKVNRPLKGGRHGGDISGIQAHLDYIKDLGFTAIWLNPLLENDMEKYSYHGYSTTDFYKVDPRFGSNETYLELANEGRKKGMKLIMDMIVNHCGSAHWWMKDIPTKDWFNQWQEYTETNHRKTVLQDPYASELDKKEFTDGWFVPTMPDLNQRNKLLAQYLIQNSIWWVEYLGLSGIRMDTYSYPDMDFMSAWTKAMMKEYPNLNIVGEEWFELPTIIAYWQKGKENPNGYTSELKSLMDFPGHLAMVNALNEKETWSTGWIELYETLAQDFLYADPMNLVIFPDNHDMPRFYAQVKEDFELWKQGIAFILTTRGIPQIYYGTEILMTSPEHRDDGIIRSDFPGGWKGDEINAFTGKGLNSKQKAAKKYLKQLLQWRKTASAIHAGQLKHFIPKDGVYVYFRYDAQQKIMIILNKNQNDTELDLSRFSEMLHGVSEAKDVVSAKSFPIKDKILLTKKAALILELK